MFSKSNVAEGPYPVIRLQTTGYSGIPKCTLLKALLTCTYKLLSDAVDGTDAVEVDRQPATAVRVFASRYLTVATDELVALMDRMQF